MDGSLVLFLVLLVGFLALGLAALGAGADSREFDPRRTPATPFAKGD